MDIDIVNKEANDIIHKIYEKFNNRLLNNRLDYNDCLISIEDKRDADVLCCHYLYVNSMYYIFIKHEIFELTVSKYENDDVYQINTNFYYGYTRFNNKFGTHLNMKVSSVDELFSIIDSLIHINKYSIK